MIFEPKPYNKIINNYPNLIVKYHNLLRANDNLILYLEASNKAYPLILSQHVSDNKDNNFFSIK